MTLLEFVILGLATYRLTRLITTDNIFETFRERIWKKYPPQSSKLGYLITCDWCTSIWVASVVVASAMIIPVLVYVYAVFAVSAIAGLLTAYESK
jgi:hypothetical protein